MSPAARRWTRLLALLGIPSVVLAVRFATPLGSAWVDAASWRASLAEDPARTGALFVAASAILVAMGVPRLTFAALGGALFGFALGLLLSSAGTLAGSYGTFLFARWTGRDWTRRGLAGSVLAKAVRGDPTTLTVILARQVPLPSVVVNVGLGLSSVGHRAFLVGSLVGLLPQAIVVCLIGSGLVEESLSRALLRIVVGLGLFLVALWGASVLRGLARRRGLVEGA